MSDQSLISFKTAANIAVCPQIASNPCGPIVLGEAHEQNQINSFKMETFNNIKFA